MLGAMGVGKSASRTAARVVANKAAPSLAAGFVRAVLERAIDGVGPIRPAAKSANAALVHHDGRVEEAVSALIGSHTAMAGAEGFVTNLGGVMVVALTLPANVTGLALIKCHLIAGIAHLRGYDLSDPRVRNAILACMLGRDTVTAMIRSKRLPTTPMAIATAPVNDPSLDELIAKAVTTELVGQVTGRRIAATIGRRVPLLGGAVGATGDGLGTYLVGRYTADELRDRRA